MKNLILALALLGAASFTRALGATQLQDRSQSATTADSQARSSARDVEITRMIRRDLTKDDSLSIYAKNVKVITHQGEVILRGPVKTENEENKIVAKAKQIAGETNVQNELEVKTNQ